MKQRPFYSPAFILLLGTLLLGMQFAALLHGVQHPFHPHEASCDHFISAEKQSNAALPALPLELPKLSFIHSKALPAAQIFPPLPRFFSARAPPVLFS